jgi:hypothetical protein
MHGESNRRAYGGAATTVVAVGERARWSVCRGERSVEREHTEACVRSRRERRVELSDRRGCSVAGADGIMGRDSDMRAYGKLLVKRRVEKQSNLSMWCNG